MSKTGTALLVKFIMTFLFAWVTLGMLDRNPLGWIFLVGLLGTAVNYLLGDLLVLPNYGNITASVGDGLLGALTAYVLDLLSIAFRTTFASLLLFALLIAIGEYFFHQYLLRSDKVAP